VDVARFVSFAAKKEKAVAADAKNFWHARELYSCDIGTNKDFGGRDRRCWRCGRHSHRYNDQ
jgi:hypothetical protein